MIIEQCFHQGLAIIECSVDGDIVHIRGMAAGHLPALDVAHPAVGMKNEYVDGLAISEGLDGCSAGISRCCANDRHAGLAPLQGALH